VGVLIIIINGHELSLSDFGTVHFPSWPSATSDKKSIVGCHDIGVNVTTQIFNDFNYSRRGFDSSLILLFSSETGEKEKWHREILLQIKDYASWQLSPSSVSLNRGITVFYFRWLKINYYRDREEPLYR